MEEVVKFRQEKRNPGASGTDYRYSEAGTDKLEEQRSYPILPVRTADREEGMGMSADGAGEDEDNLLQNFLPLRDYSRLADKRIFLITGGR